MLPTPTTSHVSFATIYEPSEDSFLLLDTLSSSTETKWLHRRLSPSPYFSPTIPLVLELGPGSGVVLALLAAHSVAIFGTATLCLAIDVNPDACVATARTVGTAIADRASHSLFLGSLCGDLSEAVRPGSVDVLVFNPPYVPTEEMPNLVSVEDRGEGRGLAAEAKAARETQFERESRLLALSYAGGKDGMETTDRFLEAVPRLLSRRGVAYLLLCAQNRPAKVIEEIKGWPGRDDRRKGKWRAETVGRSGKKAGWEKLVVIRIWEEEEENEDEEREREKNEAGLKNDDMSSS